MFFNISLAVSASLVNNTVVFIESLLVRLNAIAAAADGCAFIGFCFAKIARTRPRSSTCNTRAR